MNRLALMFLAAALAPSHAVADERPDAFTFEATVSAEGEEEVVEDEPSAPEETFNFGRDLGRFRFSVDLVAEEDLVDGEPLLLWGWTAAATCAVADGVRIGAEAFGEWEAEGGVATAQTFAGPSAVVSLPFLRHGGLPAPWLAFGVGFGLTETSDDLRARAILGVDW
jgi:hypothetical protein